MRKKDEKDLSAKQNQKKTVSRFQSENGDKKRKKSLGKTAPGGKKDSLRLVGEKFLKSFRMLKRSEFLAHRKESRRFYGALVMIEYAFGKNTAPKLGVTVSKKFGKAHSRNYFKRCVREAFRNHRTLLPNHLILQVSPLPKSSSLTLALSPKGVAEDLMKLAGKLPEALLTAKELSEPIDAL